MHSPSHASESTKTLKRGRSPPSPTPVDRPSVSAASSHHSLHPSNCRCIGRTDHIHTFVTQKRQTYATDVVTSPVPRHAFPGPAPTLAPLAIPPGPAHDAAYSAYVSEDWVAQTRGLRIDSPHLAQGHEVRFGPVPQASGNAAAGQVHLDVSMVRVLLPAGMRCTDHVRQFPNVLKADGDVTMASASPPRRPSEISTLGYRPNVRPMQPLPAQHTIQQTPSFQTSAHANHSQQQLQIPAIQVHAATPSPVHRDPSASLPASVRRQRFTMGPRADCEKCRMGVKGHWMHVD